MLSHLNSIGNSRWRGHLMKLIEERCFGPTANVGTGATLLLNVDLRAAAIVCAITPVIINKRTQWKCGYHLNGGRKSALMPPLAHLHTALHHVTCRHPLSLAPINYPLITQSVFIPSSVNLCSMMIQWISDHTIVSDWPTNYPMITNQLIPLLR